MTEPRILTREEVLVELVKKWRAHLLEDGRFGAWDAAKEQCADELEAALSALSADAPPRLSEAEVRTCATCRFFTSTADKARYPKANAGECRHHYMQNDEGEPFRCYEVFGCTLHQPSGETPKET